jgi:anti-sigma regulatory factor (Ser/Thr protein kinase)
MSTVGRNPGLIINRWVEFVDAQSPGTTMRGVGEPVGPDRLAPEREECHVHEALLNVALAPETPLWLVCPYDTAALTPADIEHAERNHPYVTSENGAGASARHALVDPFAGMFNAPVPPVREMSYAVTLLSPARLFAMDAALAAGVARHRAEEFVLAMSEVASNSVQHGGGTGTLRCWSEPDRFIGEVQDAGRLQEPLVGRVRPEPGGPSGYGLWIAQQLCDLVQVRSDEHRTVVRLHIRL